MAPNQKAFNVEPAHNTYIFSSKSSCTRPKILDVAYVQILLTLYSDVPDIWTDEWSWTQILSATKIDLHGR
jgi:hypothetical protein